MLNDLKKINNEFFTNFYLVQVGVYLYRRQHLKRLPTINFDNPVYKRGGEVEPNLERVYLQRENDYIDIEINETQVCLVRNE